MRDFSHEGDLMAWLTHCRRPAELPAGAGRFQAAALPFIPKASPTLEAFYRRGVFWPE